MIPPFLNLYGYSQLLPDICGVQPERIVEDLIWNRTVNISGGQGNCIAKDLYVEFQNNNFKGNAEIALFFLNEMALYF